MRDDRAVDCRARVDLPREAEVHDAHLAVARDHHVLGLEVAVDQPLFVRGLEPAAGGQVDLQDLLPRARLGLHPVAGGVTVDELHRDEDLLAKGADVVDDDDVRVREPRDRLRLAQRALASLAHRDAVFDARAQQLDGDLAIQLGIEGGVNLAHPAAPQKIQNDVAADARAPRERLEAGFVAVLAHFRELLTSADQDRS